MARSIIGGCEALCARCPRSPYEPTGIDPKLEKVVGDLRVSEALDWMMKLEFTHPNTYQGDLERISGVLEVSTLQAASLVQCAVNRLLWACEGCIRSY